MQIFYYRQKDKMLRRQPLADAILHSKCRRHAAWRVWRVIFRHPTLSTDLISKYECARARGAAVFVIYKMTGASLINNMIIYIMNIYDFIAEV